MPSISTASKNGAHAAARHNEIADLLTSEILRGQYRCGERLPSERDLSARFSANRGCVREAVKKLEQLGVVDVQPGGARVLPVEQSSLDVIGHLLKLEEFPDPQLVSDIMEVMRCLLNLSVSRAMARADEAAFSKLGTQVNILLDESTPHDEYMLARMELGKEFMQASDSLPLKLISRALRLQFLDRIIHLSFEVDQKQPRQTADLKNLKKALEQRDSNAVSIAMQTLFESSQKALLNTLHSLRDTQQEVSS